MAKIIKTIFSTLSLTTNLWRMRITKSIIRRFKCHHLLAKSWNTYASGAMVTHILVFLTLLGYKINSRVVSRNEKTNKQENNHSILIAVQLHMHSVSAILFISTLYWTYSITMHMACKTQFLKGLLSMKNRNKILLNSASII